MRIAFISNTILARDAIGKYSLYIFKALKNRADFSLFLEKDNKTKILTSKSYEWYFFKGCPLLLWYFVEWKLGKRFRFIDKVFIEPGRRWYFRRLARKFVKFDIVWLQFGLYFNGIYLLEALSKLDRRPKIIFDYHGITPPEYIDSPGKKMIAGRSREEIFKAVDGADICLVRSDYMAQELAKFSSPKKIIKVPLPIELKKSAIRKLRIASKKANILFVGRIAKHKNIEVLLQAVYLLQKQGYKIRVEIVGSFGRSSLAKEKQRLVETATELKISDNISFLGEVGNKKLARFYLSSDVLVVPSFHEGFSWPVIEAMQYGLPVIVARVGALPSTLGQAGLLFNPRNPRELAEQIKKIISNPKLQLKLTKSGRQRIKEFSFSRFKQKLDNILNNHL